MKTLHFNNYQIDLASLSDAPHFFELIENNRPGFKRFFPITCSSCTDLETTEKYLQAKETQFHQKSFYVYKIREKNASNWVGCIMLKSIDWRIPKGELAYFIDKNFEGKGVISKAVATYSNYCFEEMGFQKIFIKTSPQNIGSQRVAIKNGFKLEGTLMHEFKIDTGEIVDILYFGKVKI